MSGTRLACASANFEFGISEATRKAYFCVRKLLATTQEQSDSVAQTLMRSVVSTRCNRDFLYTLPPSATRRDDEQQLCSKCLVGLSVPGERDVVEVFRYLIPPTLFRRESHVTVGTHEPKPACMEWFS